MKNPRRHRHYYSVLLAAVTASLPLGDTEAKDAEGAPTIPYADLDRLLALIKPERGESPWREIDWLTDVTEARARSVAEDKPLVIFTAADGSPLGRT